MDSELVFDMEIEFDDFPTAVDLRDPTYHAGIIHVIIVENE